MAVYFILGTSLMTVSIRNALINFICCRGSRPQIHILLSHCKRSHFSIFWRSESKIHGNDLFCELLITSSLWINALFTVIKELWCRVVEMSFGITSFILSDSPFQGVKRWLSFLYFITQSFLLMNINSLNIHSFMHVLSYYLITSLFIYSNG